MSNNTGDRYSCSDPNCGCEIEIRRPCNKTGAAYSGADKGTSSSPAVSPISPFETVTDSTAARGIRVSNPGDYGAQGATGEGIFGTTEAGKQLPSGEGRYGSKIERSIPRESEKETTPVNGGAKDSLVCFCGHEMREVARGVSVSRTARMK